MERKNLCKTLVWLMAVFAFSVLPACSGSDGESPEPDMKLAVNELSFDAASGSALLNVQSNVEVKAVSNQTWCVVKQETTTSSTMYRFKVTTEQNTTTEDRTALITVTSGAESKSVSVVQAAADGLELVDNSVYSDISAGGAEISVKLKANGEYTVTPDVSWIKEQTTGRAAMVESTRSFIVFANVLKSSREGTITFKLNDKTATVTVKQLGNENTHANITAGSAESIARQLGLGWNLGNQFDSHNNGVASETAWNNSAVTQQTFEKVAEAGFKTVRIPVTWMGQFNKTAPYTINASWLDRIAEVVGYAENAGLKAIVNIHHDGADSDWWLSIKDAAGSDAKNNEIKAIYESLWTQIAEKFKHTGNHLIFESMNEIHDGGWGWGSNRSDGGKQYGIINEWNQLFVNTVRAVGGENADRYLAVTGYCADPDMTMDNLVIPTDHVSDRLLVAVHYYSPYEYTLNDEYSEWGHTGASGKKASYGDEDSMKDMFAKLKAKYIDKGYPVYLGETGCVHRSADRAESFRKYYLEYLCKAARTYGLAPIYWDNGSAGSGKECSGLLHHGTGAYLNNAQSVVELMVRGYYTDASSYTLETVYNNAPN